jgi:hypothetical protein
VVIGRGIGIIVEPSRYLFLEELEVELKYSSFQGAVNRNGPMEKPSSRVKLFWGGGLIRSP